MKIELDSIDLKIIQILQADAKTTTKEIAAVLSLTSTPVYERIKRLERQGLITGYHARLSKAKLGFELLAFCEVSLEAHHSDMIEKFQRDIQKLPEVFECYHMAGNMDYLLKIVVEDMESYQKFIAKKLANLKNIGRVQSFFVMKEIKNEFLLNMPS
jgi:DNA-binding Lrp family transcriptional regulator